MMLQFAIPIGRAVSNPSPSSLVRPFIDPSLNSAGRQQQILRVDCNSFSARLRSRDAIVDFDRIMGA